MPTPENICGIARTPTQPTAMYATALNHRGESIQTSSSMSPSAAPLQTMTRTSHCVVPSKAEQRERGVRARDEDEDHRVVEAARPQPPPGALPREAVVERARAEHRGERGRVHPGRELASAPSRRTTSITPAASAAKKAHSWKSPRRRGVSSISIASIVARALRPRPGPIGGTCTLRLHSPRGPLAQLVEQGTFNPKVAGSSPARPTEGFWRV